MGTLRDLVEEALVDYDIEYRVHATRRMFERQISNEDVEQILERGQIIASYEDSLPLRHVLLSGRASARPLHVAAVVNMAEKRLSVITTYEPNSREWAKDFSRRRS